MAFRETGVTLSKLCAPAPTNKCERVERSSSWLGDTLTEWDDGGSEASVVM